MNLHHLLTHLPHEQLQSLAEEFGIAYVSPSKNNLINALNVKFRDERFMAMLLDELPYEARGLFAAIAILIKEKDDQVVISEEIINAWCRKGSFTDYLKEIAIRGFLFNTNKHEKKVTLPQEIRKLAWNIYFAELPPLDMQQEISLQELPLTQTCIESVYHLLCVLRRYPGKQTQRGEIHRKIIERWKERFSQNPPDERKFQFVFNFCLHRQLIHFKKERYRPSPSVSSWFSQGNESIQWDMFANFLQSSILPNPEFQKLLILLTLIGMNHDFNHSFPVYSTSGLENQFKNWKRMHHSSGEINLGQFQENLRWLVFLGILHSDNPEALTQFSFTREGVELLTGAVLPSIGTRAKDPCLLQPNFQLLVPPAYTLFFLWKLDEICEFQRHDIMAEFCVTQSSVLFGLRAGWKKEQIMQFLTELTHDRIPGNVQYNLNEWCDRYGQVSFKRVFLLECKTAALADEITHIPGMANHLKYRVGDRHYAVDIQSAKEIFLKLQNNGYEPNVMKKQAEE